MDSTITARLIEINRQFYRTFSGEFAATRQHIQPGVQRVLASLEPGARILDLGCGNGALAAALLRADFHGTYLGLDFSEGLLEEARKTTAGTAKAAGFQTQVDFVLSDLTSPDWSDRLPYGAFDRVLAFAMLHHIPSEQTRLSILREARRLLMPGGCFIHSVWQFLNSPRWAARVLPWETLGFDPQQLDPGDTLLDWRAGGQGLRYVHHYSLAELDDLAAEAGFCICETFSSDGKEGNLGLYQTWKRVDEP
jgi:tRNA (uracil-5-)-methyltransferase TRM9